MKLYKFSTINYGTPKFSMEEFEVEEKNKTYVCKGRRFNKSDIGVVSGYSNNECILLEDNPKKAAEILMKAKERELENIREKMQRKHEEIANLERYIFDE